MGRGAWSDIPLTRDDLSDFVARNRLALAAGLGVLCLILLVALALAMWNRPAGTARAVTGLAVAVPVAAAQGALVSVTALEPVWIKVYEQDGEAMFMGELAAGQSYELPDDATRAMLWTGRPHAVEVRLGDTLLPVLGPPGRPLKDISLDRADLAARIPPSPPLPPVRG